MDCFKFGEILLPRPTDVENWAVVACDQYTSNRDYWKRLSETVTEPTTLSLILPEVYLSDADKDERVKAIINKQAEYDKAGVLQEIDGTVLLKRTTAYGQTHHGLMLLVNLDDYSLTPGEKSLIRATEAVVPERIPPRVAVRQACAFELPHIMLLIDDPNDTVIGGAKRGEVLYEGALNSNGGELTGYQLKSTEGVRAALKSLEAESVKKYGEALLFLVGDGNHSLATAKACRTADNARSHYALVEVVNIFDAGIRFEPIHRVITGVDAAALIEAYSNTIRGEGRTTAYVGDTSRTLYLPEDAIEGVRAVDAFLTGYVAEHGGTVDYIHGEDELKTIAARENGVGIVLKKMSKESLFPYIVKNGPLPKKTFSMGEADEKRYYMEARRIR